MHPYMHAWVGAYALAQTERERERDRDPLTKRAGGFNSPTGLEATTHLGVLLFPFCLAPCLKRRPNNKATLSLRGHGAVDAARGRPADSVPCVLQVPVCGRGAR